jgi:alcohol dehydrogenase (cytochrome c)
MILPGREPTPEGVVVYPGLYGATNWASPAYNPQTRLMYVATREDGTRYYRATAEYRSGAYYTAGGFRGLPGVEPSGSIKALIAATGIERWEFKLHSPPWAGVLTTAGGLVFCGTNEGHFIALDASTGKALWNFQTGGPVISSPMTYTSAGHQYIAIAAGHSLFAFTFE